MQARWFLILLLACVPPALAAEIRELWRSGLTNQSRLEPGITNSIAYVGTTATIDQDGAVLVGAEADAPSPDFPYAVHSACIARFDRQGSRQWQYLTGTNVRNGVEALATDAQGNVFFTAHLSTAEPRPVGLVKLSANGQELWRSVENFGVDASDHAADSNLALDPSGNPFFLCVTAAERDPGTFFFEIVLSKYTTDGQRLWRNALPLRGALDHNHLAKSLSALPDGSIALAAGSVVAKIDSAGRVVWWTDTSPASSVLASPKGTVCTVSLGQAYTVFSRKGRPQHAATSIASELQAVTGKGGFLLGFGGLLEEVSAEGLSRWQTATHISPLFGVDSDGDGGWLVVGPSIFSLTLAHYDQHGNETWRSNAPGFFSPVPIRGAFHRAPDETLRLIYERRTNPSATPDGVWVVAFQAIP